MAIQGKETINIGFPNQAQGSDSLYTAFNKIKNNFDTLFACASPYSTVTGNTGIFVNPNSTAGTLDILNLGVTGISVSGNGLSISGTSNGGVYTGNIVLSLDGGGGGGNGSVTSVGITSSTLVVGGTNPITSSGDITVDLPADIGLSGNLSAGNILTDNLLYANGDPYSFSGNSTPSGSDTEVQYNNAGAFGSSANFTFNQTSNTLTVPNTVSNIITSNSYTGGNLSVNGEVNLGNVSNITVTGGSANNVLVTDGTGNLSWQAQNITNIIPNIIWDPIKSLMLFKAPNETIGDLGTLTSPTANVNWNSFNNYYGLLSANVTFNFEGIDTYEPPISMISSVTLYLQQDTTGNRTITWPVGVKWPENTIPLSSTTANAIDIYTFLTFDGGNTIIGLQQVKGII